MKRTAVIILCTALLLAAGAARVRALTPKTPQWTLEMSSPVQWFRVTDFGNLLVCAQAEMKCIDPETGNELWASKKLASMASGNVEPVVGSPYLMVNVKGRMVLVDEFTGKELFDSKKAGFKVLEQVYPLYQCGGIVVVGKRSKGPHYSAAMVDMSTGTALWTKDKLERIISARALDASDMLLATLFSVQRLDAKTGTVKWDQPVSKESAQLESMGKLGALLKTAAQNMTKDMQFNADFYINEGKGLFFIAAEVEKTSKTSGGKTSKSYECSYSAYKIADGSLAWEKPYVISGKLGMVAPHDLGLIVSPAGGGKINLVGYPDGKPVWGKKGKGTKVKGGVISIIDTEKGMVVVSGTEKKGSINLINPETGASYFKKPVKIKGQIQSARMVGAGLLYTTLEELNIINIQTGMPVLPNSIQTSGTLWRIKGDDLFAFDLKKKAVVCLNLANGSCKDQIKGPVVFKGKESPNAIELNDNGVLLTSAQNIALFGPDGSAKFHQYYQAPSNPGWKKALLYAQGARAALISVQAGMASAMFHAAGAASKDKTGKQIGSAIGSAYGDLSKQGASYAESAFKKATHRFTASKQARDYMFMMMKSSKKGVGLAQINKNSGQVEAAINLGKDKEPSYDVDDIIGKVYYQSGKQMVECYSF